MALDHTNPFAAPSTLDYQLPPLAQIRTEHFLPAITDGLEQQRAEWEAVATSPEPATFANTVEAIERSGELLRRVLPTFWIYTSSLGGSDLDALDEQVTPLLTEHRDAFLLDPRLLARYDAIADAAENAGTTRLTAEQSHVLGLLRSEARRAGVGLDEAGTAHLRELNARISALETAFGQRVVAGMAAAAVPVTDEAELAGISDGDRASFRRSAQDRGAVERGVDHLITMILPTSQPVIADAESPVLRSRVQEASVTRGGGHDPESDTRGLIVDLVRARAERAELLGFPHHAAYVAAGGTAGTTDAVMDMLTGVVPAATRNARAELAELQDLAARPSPEERPLVTAADWPFYARRVRQERYDIDLAELRPYFELDRVVVDGVLWTATQLYGLTFRERTDLPVYADGMRVWEVFDGEPGVAVDAPDPADAPDGTGMGLFMLDPYAREGKRGGAWMTGFVDQSHLLGTRPVVTNTLNVPRPPAGEPTLLTWDEVNTLFHEFGHALHGLLSDVTYPSWSGTEVPRDFVEYPSQVNEMWMTHPVVIERYARHHETGEPLDPAIVERLREADRYGEGFATTEYLAAALLDQVWHQVSVADAPTGAEEVLAFETAALLDLGLDIPQVPPRYRSTYFNHTFGGGYDAGYYSYFWSEVLDADTQAWFEEGENGGLDPARGRRFRDVLLSRGHSGDPLGFYRELRGRDADVAPLLARRGLL
ncbi:M3 family metallopeptidase [Salana multivorans]|uniref:M3 family metallopeptidase n=1 Tax=Salana multivorans TaxID=120377 RepID=UPI00248FC55E|nr:M3 family metallopeptidase [Salana multivorans]